MSSLTDDLWLHWYGAFNLLDPADSLLTGCRSVELATPKALSLSRMGLFFGREIIGQNSAMIKGQIGKAAF